MESGRVLRYNTSTNSKELDDLLAVWKAKQPSIDDMMEYHQAILIRISECKPGERVWCKGSVHGPNRHYPAVVIYNATTEALHVLAPSGPDCLMEDHPVHLFHSNIPHIGIAREVTSDNSGGTV